MDNLINRQDAIDAWWYDEVFFGNQRDDMTKEQWLDYITDVIDSLPAADAIEVVRCKDCRHWHREIHNGIEYFNFNSCDLKHYGDGHNFYCADAERRTYG